MKDDFLTNLTSFINGGLEEVLSQKMDDACQLIENEAKENCPVDDGVLKASITHSVQADNNKITGVVGTNVEYAPYVHEGTGIYAVSGNGRKQVPWVYKDAKGDFHSTKGQKPNPFLKDALLNSENTIQKIFKDTLK